MLPSQKTSNWMALPLLPVRLPIHSPAFHLFQSHAYIFNPDMFYVNVIKWWPIILAAKAQGTCNPRESVQYSRPSVLIRASSVIHQHSKGGLKSTKTIFWINTFPSFICKACNAIMKGCGLGFLTVAVIKHTDKGLRNLSWSTASEGYSHHGGKNMPAEAESWLVTLNHTEETESEGVEQAYETSAPPWGTLFYQAPSPEELPNFPISINNQGSHAQT